MRCETPERDLFRGEAQNVEVSEVAVADATKTSGVRPPLSLERLVMPMTSKQYAAALLDEWQHGTDLKDQLSRDVWNDYDEKATAAFQQCKKEQLEEIISMVKERCEEPQFVQSLMIKLLTMKQDA